MVGMRFEIFLIGPIAHSPLRKRGQTGGETPFKKLFEFIKTVMSHDLLIISSYLPLLGLTYWKRSMGSGSLETMYEPL